LSLLARTNDGFEIANKDLELRGPGDIMGYRQSGSMAHHPMSAMGDAKILKETHDAAREIIHNSEAPESKVIIRLARDYIAGRFKTIALN
jgi:ATP-dependent DNA helicase RecG